METLVPQSRQGEIEVIFLTGLYFQLGQIILFREIMVLSHGTEQLWGAILAFWMLGAALGVRWNHRSPFDLAPDAPYLTLWPLFVAGPTLAGLVVGLRLSAWYGSFQAGQMISLGRGLITAALGTMPLAWLSGRQFGLLIRWAGPRSLGRLYRAEAWGAMFGGLLTGLVLECFGQVLPLALGG
ncbi:MAG: hypothetical protein HQK55_16275, partial [Deltaproteobacteria bacterium]|nr:hypothetical protein [Deltaproteobacteria bacterium]